MKCECEKEKSDAKPVQKRSICNKVHNTNSTNRDYTLYTKKRFFPSIRAPSNIFCLECTCFLNHWRMRKVENRSYISRKKILGDIRLCKIVLRWV
jgi:hypothetical protein